MKKTFRLSELSNNEIKYLRYFSVLPEKWFSFNNLLDLFRLEQDSDVEFFDIIHDLSKKGWLIREDKSYKVSSYTHTIILKKFPPDTTNCSVIIDSLNEKTVLKNDEKAETKKKYIPYVESVFLSINDNSISLTTLASNLALLFSELRIYRKAIEYHLKAIQIDENIGHPNLLISYRHVAQEYRNIRNYSKSIEYTKRLINILEQEREIDRNYPALAYYYYNIAVSYYDMMDFKNAKKYIDKVVEIDKKFLDKDSPDFKNDIKLQKRIYNTYKISRHLRKYIKVYLIIIFFLLLSGGVALFLSL